MIKNWKRKELNMSFEGIEPHPSDIDMFVLKGNTLIIGEIKNELGFFKQAQRNLLQAVVDGWKYKAILLYIEHDKYVEKGDSEVEIATCQVREYYFKGKWHEPKKYTTVKEIVENFR